MLPPNQTFFKFSMDDLVIKQQAELAGITSSQYQTELNKGLSRVEKMLLDYQEQLADRVCAGEAIKHLYIAGNVFLVHDPKEGLKYYPLDRFCLKRDYCGNVIKAITEETISLYSLPEGKQVDGNTKATAYLGKKSSKKRIEAKADIKNNKKRLKEFEDKLSSKMEYITMSKRGHFWKVNITDPMTQ